VLALSVWFGLTTWLAEAVTLGARHFIWGRLRVWLPESLLLGPIAYMLAFGLLGLLLIGLARLWPRLATARAVLVVLVAAAAGSVLLIFERQLGALAVALLAMGIAWESSRRLAARLPGFRRVVRRTALPLAAAAVVLAIAGAGRDWLTERRHIAALPPSADSVPNVLLLIIDTGRMFAMSAYGHERPTTPQIAAFAENGVLFERAISTASWTVPAHGSMLTGRYADKLGAAPDTPLKIDGPTLAEVPPRAPGVLWRCKQSRWGYRANYTTTFLS
jgi:glucan phosphoethanolaminetransferase (alkaline phosphatase superfamily)